MLSIYSSLHLIADFSMLQAQHNTNALEEHTNPILIYKERHLTIRFGTSITIKVDHKLLQAFPKQKVRPADLAELMKHESI